MKDLSSNQNEKVAFCGLYCGNCSRYKSSKCPGCINNIKATWCKIRSCCIEKGIATCAECDEYSFAKQCSKYNNVFSKLIEFISRTDRSLGIVKIKEIGIEGFTLYMEQEGRMSLPKEKK